MYFIWLNLYLSRYLKKDKLIHPPPLNEGEALASRILELGPAKANFLGPVIIEVSLSIFSIYLNIYKFIYLSIYLYSCISIYLSFYLSIFLFIYISICLSIHLFIYISIKIFIHLSVDFSF